MNHDKTPCPSPDCPICAKARLKEEQEIAQENLQERYQKQLKERHAASDRTWEYVKRNDARYTEHRAKILSKRSMLKTGYLDSGIPNKYDVYMVFRISAHALTIKTKTKVFTIHATSGKDEYLNNNSIESQKASYKGVTPVGKYIIKPSEFSDPNIIVDIKRNVVDRADWGDWRVRMHNKTDENFNYYGRDNFFLHCGSKAGSAGCIDIGGGLLGNEISDEVAEIIVNSEKDILLEVKL